MAKILTKGTGLNPAAELEEWRRVLARFGKKLPKRRYRIINGYVHYHGTIDILSLYWLGDLHVARKKSSLNGERFNKEKCFEGSRRSAERFAEGNRLASKTYALVDKQKKVYFLFCFLKKKAILLIKEGKSAWEAEACLVDYLKDFKLLPTPAGKFQRHVPDEQEAGCKNEKVFPREKILQIHHQVKIVSSSFNDTG